MKNLMTQPLTMSSREIAKLCEKQHKNVVRDIEKMATDCNLTGSDLSRLAGTYMDAKGEQRKCYNLPKNLTITLIAGYRSDLRLKIIDRWMELEAQPSITGGFSIPGTYSEALRLAADLEEELQVARPQVAALNLISQHAEDIGVRDMGRELKIGQTSLVRYLLDHRWACRDGRGRKLKPAHYGLSKGYVRLITQTYTDQNGEVRVVDELRISPKGRVRLAKIFAQEEAKS